MAAPLTFFMRIPDAVTKNLISCYGEQGRDWLERLPQLVAEISDQWELRVSEPFGGGCVAWVAPAVRADGSAAVLKISIMDDETRYEADALAFWEGCGAVRLLRRDTGRGAMLLERLDPGRPLTDLDEGEALRIACGLLRRLWRPLPPGSPFPDVARLLGEWRQQLPALYEKHSRPFAAGLLDRAVRLCDDLLTPRLEQVLGNRDFHFGNILSSTREPWLLIDPKPLAGEPASDTGYLLESLLDPNPDPARAVALARAIALELELDPQRIADWAFLRAVENALWAAGTQPASVATYVATAQSLLPR